LAWQTPDVSGFDQRHDSAKRALSFPLGEKLDARDEGRAEGFVVNLDPDCGIPRIEARNEGLPTTGRIFCGVARYFKPSEIEKADTAYATDIRMAF